MAASDSRAAPPDRVDGPRLAAAIVAWARELGFQAVGIADTDLSDAEAHLVRWLAAGRHGEMAYMARHGTARTRPAELVPGTLRVITARMDYWPAEGAAPGAVLRDPDRAYIARYALGRDYHKVLRARLQQLADRIRADVGAFGYRVFTDSAPVMEVALAAKAGLGWRGKHTLLLTRETGSYFFLGEIYTDLPLPVTPAVTEHCGTCTACIGACPTGAIVAPYELDARRCISYLTIELAGAIPEALRPLIGNRVYGCDDCQLACPWNRFAQARRRRRLPRGAQRSRRRDARRALRLDRARVQHADGRQRDPPDRLRTLVAQSRRGARQCAARRRRARGAGTARRRPVAARARARGVGNCATGRAQ